MWIIALVVLVVVLVAAYWGYNKCKFNDYLSSDYQKDCSDKENACSHCGSPEI